MNLRQLQYFKTIAELEHYTRAAEKLFVSQSNLSHAIKELEEELGVEFFVRKGRNVKLTKYGELFLPYVTEALNQIETGVHHLDGFINPDTGSVVMAGFSSLSQFIPDVIVRYLSETNRVGVHLNFSQSASYTDLREELKNGSIDLAFATRIDDPGIEGTLIGEHQIVLIAPLSHPLAKETEVDLRVLDKEPFIAFNKDCEIRSFTDRYFAELGIHPHISMETAQDVLVYGMVGANQGLAVVPRPIGAEPYNVKILNISNPIPPRKLYLMWNTNRYMPPAAGYFRDYVVEKGLIFDQFIERINSEDRK